MDKRRLTSDGVGLAILGASSTLRGVSYLPGVVNHNRNPAHLLEYALSPEWWSLLWLIVGLTALVATIWYWLRPGAVGLVIGLHFLWGVSFLAVGGRGWVSALSYTSIAFVCLWAFGRGRLPGGDKSG